MLHCPITLDIDGHPIYLIFCLLSIASFYAAVAESLHSSQTCASESELDQQDRPLSCAQSITRVDAYLKSDSELRKLAAAATAPIVFTHVAHRIFGSNLWEWGPDKLRDNWGDEKVTLSKRSKWVSMFGPEHDHNALFANMSFNLTLAQLLQQTESGNSLEELFINGHSHPVLLGKLRETITLPPFDMAENERYSSLVLSVGSEHSGLPMHYHGDSWLAQLHGTKRWWLLPPIANVSKLPPKLYRRLFFTTAATWNSTMNLEKHRINGDGYELYQACDVQVGEVIFIPQGWYHATANIGGQALAIGGQRFGQDLTVADILNGVKTLDNRSAHATSTAAVKVMAIGDKRYNSQALELLVRTVRLHPLAFSPLFRAIKLSAELDEFTLSCELLLLAMESLEALLKERYISDEEWASLVARIVVDWHLYTDPKSIFNLQKQWKLKGKKLNPSRWLLAVYKAVLGIIPKSAKANLGHKVWHEQFSITE